MANVSLDYQVDFGEIEVGEGPSDPIMITGQNISGGEIRVVRVALAGDAATMVQLAEDVNGLPDTWQNPGTSILVADSLMADEQFTFWARVQTPATDEELGPMQFEYVVSSKRFV